MRIEGPLEGSLVFSGELPLMVPQETWPKVIEVTRGQAEALQRIFNRDKTAWEVHGGLKGLLSLSQPDVDALEALVKKLFG